MSNSFDHPIVRNGGFAQYAAEHGLPAGAEEEETEESKTATAEEVREAVYRIWPPLSVVRSYLDQTAESLAQLKKTLAGDISNEIAVARVFGKADALVRRCLRDLETARQQLAVAILAEDECEKIAERLG